MNLRSESRLRFPSWSRQQRARWVLAKLRAARLPQKWARMVPMTTDQLPPKDQLTPRTLREALQ